jgi:hypothetical protein
MKKCFWLFSILLLSVSISSCDGEVESEEDGLIIEDNYDSFQSFDLKPFDVPASIMLPDETANIGASTRPEVMHKEGGFKWDIVVGPNFKVHIEDWGANKNLVEEKKKQLKELEIFDINFLVDEPDFLIYQLKLKVDGATNAPKTVGVPHQAYHVFAEKVIDGITYEFRSPDDGYEKVIIELMAKSIRSVNAEPIP